MDTGETRQGWTDARRGRKHRMAGSRNLIIRADQGSDPLSHRLSSTTVRNRVRQSIPDTAAEQCVLKKQNNSLIRNIQILICCHSFLLASKMCSRNSRIKSISHLPPCRRAECEYGVIAAASCLQLCWYSVRQQGRRVTSPGIFVISQISVVEMIFFRTLQSRQRFDERNGRLWGMAGNKRKIGTVLYLLKQTKQAKAKTGPFITFLLQY